jgi:secreted Zn-dependent insulinase-like peptidase
MAQAVLQEILNQLRELEIEELQEVDQAVQQYLVARAESNQAIQQSLAERALPPRKTAFDQALLDSGLVEQIKHPTYRQEAQQQLIQIQGKPLSETIIEERR